MVKQRKRARAEIGLTFRFDTKTSFYFYARALWLAGLLLLVGMALDSRYAASAGSPSPLIKLEATLSFKADTLSVAVNADESLIATALSGSEETATVVITDRRSRRALGEISAEVGKVTGLEFSPVEDLLLIAGQEALQLWQVPIAPLKTGQPLPGKYLRWSVALEEDAPVAQMAFGQRPATVTWSAGTAIFRRGTAAGSPFKGEPAWKREGKSEGPLRFATAPGGGRLVLYGGGSKVLTTLDSRTFKEQAGLSGHRFPVAAAAFSPAKVLVSLDSGYNLVRWGREGEPRFTDYPDIPKDSPEPHALLSIAGPHYLILTGEEGGLLVDAATGKVFGNLPRSAAAGVAVSPTGRYLLVGGGREVLIYRFAKPQPPQEYVQRLKALGAHATARNFVNLLDREGLPDNLKSRLLSQLETVPPQGGLQDYLASLASATDEENLDGMVYWGEKILSIEPNHPQAKAALARVKELRENQLLAGARKALATGQPRQAIAMLSAGIPGASPRYGEALGIIREAESARNIQTALEQAREKMDLANFPAAKALVSEVLRKDNANQTALALREEISDREGGSPFEPLTMLFVAVLAMALLGGGLFLLRNFLAPLLRKVSLQETEPLRPPPDGARTRTKASTETRAGTAPGQGGQAGPAPTQREGKIPPRPDADRRALRRAVEALFEKTEEMVHLSRQRDARQQHTSFLLEMEAELNALRRRMMERTAELEAARTRLEGMARQLGNLKFTKPAPVPAGRGDATYYEILRLPPDSSLADIKSAYHKLLKEYHPDLHNRSDFGWVREEAEKMSRKISEAYEVLSDAAKREQYNQTLQRKRSFQA